MSNEQTVPPADDFKQIKGIGPVTERHLHRAGFLRYAQIAASTPSELATLVKEVAGMTAERITQEDWVGQARHLAAETPPAAGGSSTPGNGQHYATFTVELLLDQDNEVRRTRVVHVQAKQKETWAGWQPEHLVELIAARANLPEKPRLTAVPTHPDLPAPSSKAAAGMRLEPVDEQRMMFNPARPQGDALPEQQSSKPVRPSPTAVRLLPAQLKCSHGVIEHGRSFDVQLALNLSPVQQSSQASLAYRATLYAANISDGGRQQIGSIHGSVEAADTLTIHLPGQIPAPGTYRLAAEVTLTGLPATSDLTSVVKGDLLHVY